MADLVGAALGLLLLSPLFAAVAVLVKLDNRGPVFFGSERWGQGGKRIRIWKFRTMVDGASALLEKDRGLRASYERELKLRTDPRVTRVGKWLRRLSIDELPQLVNVLRGEMSLVGPRMITPAELPEWGDTAGLLLSVRPGLTGLWQVSGRQQLTKADRIRLDGDYVNRMSLSLDLAILARTVPAVLSSRGAY